MEREGIEKILFPQFGNRKGIKKNIPRLRKREGNGKKNILKIQEREGNEKINSHNSGMGIRGFHSWEWTGTGIPAHPWMPPTFPIASLNRYTSKFSGVFTWPIRPDGRSL